MAAPYSSPTDARPDSAPDVVATEGVLDDAPVVGCGDRSCGSDETAASCPEDCPSSCGDNACTHGENPASCAEDCPPTCGDRICSSEENPSSCSTDCPTNCGDGLCTTGESPLTCLQDCKASCGDTICTAAEETPSSCPQDCPPKCPDGLCSPLENALTCAADCPASCGDQTCSGSETALNCPSDCPAKCGDGGCTQPENIASCAADCGVVCGDKICSAGAESVANCPSDCPAKCDDGICSSGESSGNCAADCPPIKLAPVADAHIRDGDYSSSGGSGNYEYNNYGDSSYLYVGSDDEDDEAARSLLRFDLNGIPSSCTIATARLFLYFYDQSWSTSPDIQVRRLTASWSESSVTWRDRSSGWNNEWNNRGGDYASTVEATERVQSGQYGWISWDVANLVKAWRSGTPNHGLLLREPSDSSDNRGRKRFRSREYGTSSLRPYLEIGCAP